MTLSPISPSNVATTPVDPLDQVIEGWLRNFTERTRGAYRADLNQWREWIRVRGGTMAAAEWIHFNAWCTEMRDGVGRSKPYAQTTRARKESAVTSFYDYCVEVRLLPRSPAHQKGAKLRTRPGAPEKPTPALEGEQRAQFLAAAATLGPKARTLCSVLYTTGCRISELLSADVGDLHQLGGATVLSVLRKGEKHDQLPIQAPADVAFLAEHTAERGAATPLLLGRGDLGRMTNDEADWIIAKAGRAAGVSYVVTPHVLRTTAINRLLELGLTMEEVRQFAGHASLTTTQIYDRRRVGAAKRASMSAQLAEDVPE